MRKNRLRQMQAGCSYLHSHFSRGSEKKIHESRKGLDSQKESKSQKSSLQKEILPLQSESPTFLIESHKSLRLSRFKLTVNLKKQGS